MAELVYALGLGPSVFDVWVQVPLSTFPSKSHTSEGQVHPF